MFVGLRVLMSFVVLCGLASCAAPIDIEYENAICDTESYLQQQRPTKLFGLRQLRDEDAMVFQFIDGSFSKAAVVFPLRVTAVLSPAKEGRKTHLEVEAFQRGVLLTSKRGGVAAKWRQLITNSLFSL